MLKFAHLSLRVRTAPQTTPKCRYHPFHDIPFTPAAFPPPANQPAATRLEWNQLLYELTQSSPAVWNTYSRLTELIGPQNIPAGIHREVLKKALAPAERSGRLSMQQLQNKQAFYPHETRLKSIMANLRSTGARPNTSDYNFVLEQFAKVGHVLGARVVFREMLTMNIRRNHSSYGRCLQAIAYRLSLPIGEAPKNEVLYFCQWILNDMKQCRVRLTLPNFDLLCRIYKDAQQFDVFNELLKTGLGIDLSCPDRLSLEVQEQLAKGEIPSLLPLTTDTLNTIIHFLGETRQITKMVAAFEVLSSPLPLLDNPNQWADKDDDHPALFQFHYPDAPPYPSAEPNITTYAYLVLHASSVEYDTIAKHYIKMAFDLERGHMRRIESEIRVHPLEKIDYPNVRVNGAMLFYFYKMCCAMRVRPAGLEWGRYFIRDVIHTKEDHMDFLLKWRQGRLAELENQPSLATDKGPFSRVSPGQPLLNVRRKQFDINLHLAVLRRDIKQLRFLLDDYDHKAQRIFQGYYEGQANRVLVGQKINEIWRKNPTGKKRRRLSFQERLFEKSSTQ